MQRHSGMQAGRRAPWQRLPPCATVRQYPGRAHATSSPLIHMSGMQNRWKEMNDDKIIIYQNVRP